MATVASFRRALREPIVIALRSQSARRLRPRPIRRYGRYSSRLCSRATRWTASCATRRLPVVTERSLVGRSVLKGALERWQRIAVASAKQCGRARLPAIDPPQPLRVWLEAPFDGRRLLLAEPSSGDDHIQTMRAGLAGPVPPRVACIVGPEGGWSASEREAATTAGCVLVSLGSMTLRADAVGMVAVSLVNFAFEDA